MKRAFLEMAVNEAERSYQNFKHGAILVKGGKVISTGHNKVSTRCPAHMYSIHAESAAIKNCTEKTGSLSNTHVYVVRINKTGLAGSLPCAKCQRFMKIHGVSRVFYSTGRRDQLWDSMYIT